MDDTFRRQWAIQVARERADEARELHRRSIDEEQDRRPLEHSRWLGLQVRAVTQTALDRAHNESRPTVIEFDTYRYYGHSVADAKHKGGYRKEDEIEKHKNEHDPIRIFKNRLIAEKVINEEQYEAIDATLKTEANAAAQFADKSEPPSIESVFEDVYYEVDQKSEAGRTGRYFFND